MLTNTYSDLKTRIVKNNIEIHSLRLLIDLAYTTQQISADEFFTLLTTLNTEQTTM